MRHCEQRVAPWATRAPWSDAAALASLLDDSVLVLRSPDGRVLGVIQMINKLTGGVFDEDDVRVAVAVADLTATALQNCRIHARAIAQGSFFHGCSAEVVDNIIANGLNRSYAGQHATVYGKGVYFARDASYSARETYSPKDDHGLKRVLLCRLALGSHIQVPKGYGNKITELEPPVQYEWFIVRLRKNVCTTAASVALLVSSYARALPMISGRWKFA